VYQTRNTGNCEREIAEDIQHQRLQKCNQKPLKNNDDELAEARVHSDIIGKFFNMIYIILFIFAQLQLHTHTHTHIDTHNTIVTTPLRRGSVDGIIKPSHVDPIPEWPGRASGERRAGGRRPPKTMYDRRGVFVYSVESERDEKK